jgi:hypothetical protein
MHGLFGFKNGRTGKVESDSWSKVDLRRLSQKEWKLVGPE